jgi:hypothetical protein
MMVVQDMNALYPNRVGGCALRRAPMALAACALWLATGCSPSLDTQGRPCSSDRDCADHSMVCDRDRDPPVCVAPSDECSIGQSRCDGSVLQICAADENLAGVLRWIDQRDCADQGAVCVAGDDMAACEEQCNDTCPAAGQSRCAGDVVQSCAMADDGCLHWRDDLDCAAAGSSCEMQDGRAGCSCNDTCDPEGSRRCNGTIIERCALGPDGCRRWEPEQDCADDDALCDDTGDGAACVDDCIDPCATLDEKRCSPDDSAVQICQDSGQGCWQWVLEEDCAGRTPPATCVELGGSPLCQHNCANECQPEEAGDGRCVDNVAETCTENADGCFVWAFEQACDDDSLVCDLDGDGASVCVDPAGIPEQTTIRNGSFELDLPGTAGDEIAYWDSELDADGQQNTILVEVTAAYGFAGEQSLHLLLSGSTDGSTGIDFIHTLSTDSPRRTHARHVTLWVTEDVSDGTTNLHFAKAMRLVFDDGEAVVPVQLRCSRGGYSNCYALGSQDTIPPYDHGVEQQTGGGGLIWKRYTVDIPEEIDRSRLKVGVWYRLRAADSQVAMAELEIYFDRVFFSDENGNPL